jgi:hypothetical protein
VLTELYVIKWLQTSVYENPREGTTLNNELWMMQYIKSDLEYSKGNYEIQREITVTREGEIG